MWLSGARSAAIIYEDYGSYFFTDLGNESAQLAASEGYDVRLVRRLSRSAGSVYDEALLDEAVAAAVASRADVLLLAVRQPEWERALERLSAARPPVADGHVFKAVWFQGASWGSNCVGTGRNCSYVVGATQMADSEALDGYQDGVLGHPYRCMLPICYLYLHVTCMYVTCMYVTHILPACR